MIKVGIVADNYKVDRFKKELTKAWFTDFDVSPFSETCTTIMVNVRDDQVNDVQRICQQVELHFKRGN